VTTILRRLTIPGAERALADVEQRGGRSLTEQAIVCRLAADLSARAQGDAFRMGFELIPYAGVGATMSPKRWGAASITLAGIGSVLRTGSDGSPASPNKTAPSSRCEGSWLTR
jgi:hypothetical protein